MQTYAMRQLFKGRQQAQVFTDERIKTISELLSGIRIVKFFAWEKPILTNVATSRKRELGKVRKLLSIRAANQAIAMSIPLLSSVLVFAVYSLTGHTQVCGTPTSVVRPPSPKLTVHPSIRTPPRFGPLCLY